MTSNATALLPSTHIPVTTGDSLDRVTADLLQIIPRVSIAELARAFKDFAAPRGSASFPVAVNDQTLSQANLGSRVTSTTDDYHRNAQIFELYASQITNEVLARFNAPAVALEAMLRPSFISGQSPFAESYLNLSKAAQLDQKSEAGLALRSIIAGLSNALDKCLTSLKQIDEKLDLLQQAVADAHTADLLEKLGLRLEDLFTDPSIKRDTLSKSNAGLSSEHYSQTTPTLDPEKVYAVTHTAKIECGIDLDLSTLTMNLHRLKAHKPDFLQTTFAGFNKALTESCEMAEALALKVKDYGDFPLSRLGLQAIDTILDRLTEHSPGFMSSRNIEFFVENSHISGLPQLTNKVGRLQRTLEGVSKVLQHQKTEILRNAAEIATQNLFSAEQANQPGSFRSAVLSAIKLAGDSLKTMNGSDSETLRTSLLFKVLKDGEAKYTTLAGLLKSVSIREVGPFQLLEIQADTCNFWNAVALHALGNVIQVAVGGELMRYRSG